MNFVALDFETANEKIESVCQLGLVVVAKNKIVEKASWLIRPKENTFNPFNTYIHKITAKKVENEPEFGELWPTIKHYLEGETIIAHNASFDVAVLRNVLDLYNIAYPKADYLCSVKIAKKVWTEINRHGLKAMAEHLGIDFCHHDAKEDAYASAEIVRLAAKKLEVKSLTKLLEKIEIFPGKLHPTGFIPIRQLNEYNLTKVDPKKLDSKHPLFKQTVVFTGKLETMVRRVAMQKVADVGGICQSSVNEFTNILVVGNSDYKRFKDGYKSSKLKRADDLIENGYPVEMITEKDLLGLLKK
ncbi:MAG: hypothetical protein C4562_00085 [Actinobacteria bacterium]|nr:MAG: hypothetical protein C4562_00085 [Actinomycetota bacterium]